MASVCDSQREGWTVFGRVACERTEPRLEGIRELVLSRALASSRWHRAGVPTRRGQGSPVLPTPATRTCSCRARKKPSSCDDPGLCPNPFPAPCVGLNLSTASPDRTAPTDPDEALPTPPSPHRSASPSPARLLPQHVLTRVLARPPILRTSSFPLLLAHPGR
jgi:hypothetical protein